jgi:hypothetical protein
LRDGPAQHSQLAAGGKDIYDDDVGSSAGWLLWGPSHIYRNVAAVSTASSAMCVCVCVRDISPYIVYTWDVTVYLIPTSVMGHPVVFSSLF